MQEAISYKGLTRQPSDGLRGNSQGINVKSVNFTTHKERQKIFQRRETKKRLKLSKHQWRRRLRVLRESPPLQPKESQFLTHQGENMIFLRHKVSELVGSTLKIHMKSMKFTAHKEVKMESVIDGQLSIPQRTVIQGNLETQFGICDEHLLVIRGSGVPFTNMLENQKDLTHNSLRVSVTFKSKSPRNMKNYSKKISQEGNYHGNLLLRGEPGATNSGFFKYSECFTK